MISFVQDECTLRDEFTLRKQQNLVFSRLGEWAANPENSPRFLVRAVKLTSYDPPIHSFQSDQLFNH